MFRFIYNIYISIYNMCCINIGRNHIRYVDLISEVDNLNSEESRRLRNYIMRDRCC